MKRAGRLPTLFRVTLQRCPFNWKLGMGGVMRRLFFWLIVLLVIAGAGLYFFADTVLKVAIERGGSSLAETDVAVESLDVAVTESEGSINITGLTIANPQGFSDSVLLSLQGINLVIDIERSSLSVLVIEELRVDNPQITYELGGGGNNMDKLMENIERNVGGSSSGSGSGMAPRYIIDQLIVTPGEVTIQLGSGKIASASLPEINLTDIGADSGGVTAGELGEIIMSQINVGVTTQVTVGALANVIGGGIGAVGGTVGDTGKAVGESIGGAIKGIFDRD